MSDLVARRQAALDYHSWILMFLPWLSDPLSVVAVVVAHDTEPVLDELVVIVP